MATPFQATIYGHYPLTIYLVEQGVLQITTDYHSLNERPNPQLQSEQLAALRVTGAWHLPYASNGIISTLISSGSGLETEVLSDDPTLDAAPRTDSIALALVETFVARGAEKLLPYPVQLRPATAGNDSSATATASYFGLLVQTDDKAQPLMASAREQGLSCLISQEGRTDDFNVVALLSGGTRGIYGLEAADGRFPELPADSSGREAFAR